MSIKVRSGVRTSEDRLEYKISTSEAKKYLQTKFDLIAEAAKNKGVKIPDIKIVMYSQKLGKNFLPFFLILPEDVLQKSNNNDDEFASFWLPEHEDSCRLNKFFYQLLSSYTYNKDDKRAFRSQVWKRSAGIGNAKILGTLLKYSTPKVEDFGKGGKKVVVLIDPIRLFHDMLVNDAFPKQKFEILIQDWNEINTGEGDYEFTMIRRVLKEKGPNKDEIYAKMLRKINGQ